MNQQSKEDLVKDFMKKVKKALPDWLKDKKEHKDVLTELEEHIWQKATEISETGQPTEQSVRKAIVQMGTPKSIAKEYKRRGEPKVYITKEMWPLYTRVLGIVFAVIIILNLVGMIASILTEVVSLEQLIDGFVTGIQMGLLASFVIISIIFVVLSMEGYFPEDFKSKKEQKLRKLELEKAAEAGTPVSEVLAKPLKPFIKPIGEVIAASIGLIFGVLLLFQPFPTFMFIPDFLVVLRFAGLLLIIEGILDVSRGIIGNRKPETHQVLHVFIIIIKFLWIPLFLYLMFNPAIFPYFSEPWVHVGIPVEFYDEYQLGFVALIVIVCLTTIEDFYKIFKLQKYKV
ncbi:MAG: hypothetical protein EAX89_00975 [Candidatus Lokiarchaeota archaeon]|nr:hypothetical protein [Candidatus Lokiarchaeota archaeon]